MIRVLSLFVITVSFLYAENFEQFLNKALEDKGYLSFSQMEISKTKLEGEILNRGYNPSLEFELLEYDRSSGDEDGFRVALSQKLKMWGVSEDTRVFTQAKIHRAESQHNLNRAMYIKNISMKYLAYKYTKQLQELAIKEEKIVYEIYQISQKREQLGSTSKGIMLHSKVDYEMAQVKLLELQLKERKNYFDLLELTSFSKPIALDITYSFSTQQTSTLHPELEYLKDKAFESSAKEALHSRVINSFELLGEYEHERDQDIYHIGISAELPIFNTKSQERRIAKLQTKQTELLLALKQKYLSVEQIRLQEQEKLLLSLKQKSFQTLQTQNKLLKMYEEGYAIAKVNFIELQNVKNKVIETEKKLIGFRIELEKIALEVNYISGVYNE